MILEQRKANKNRDNFWRWPEIEPTFGVPGPVHYRMVLFCKAFSSRGPEPYRRLSWSVEKSELANGFRRPKDLDALNAVAVCGIMLFSHVQWQVVHADVLRRGSSAETQITLHRVGSRATLIRNARNRD